MATALFHALAVLSGKVTSPCGYATHYYNPRLAKPPWAYDAHGQLIDPVAVLGDHVFLENIP
jgi:spore germination cell wall hydrolase CwlJ-like protein